MLSRRNFVRALATALVAGGCGAFLWRIRRGRPNPSSNAGPPVSVSGKPMLSFFLLSDIHISAAVSTMSAKLHAALKDIAGLEAPVDAIVLGGDMVDGGREEEYQLLGDILSEYELPPIYGNMGNHEYYHIWYDERGNWSTETGPNGKTDAEARERFMRFIGYEDRPYHDVWVNGVHLILLSQEAYVQEKPEVGEGAWYSDAQMTWFAECMQSHADGRPAFIFIHQPLPPAGSDGGSHRLIRAKEFREILRPYRNLFVFSGHTHRNLETEGRYVRDTSFHWFSNASVGKTRGAGSVPDPIQGLYVQVYPDQVLVVGREFSNRTWIKAAKWTVALTQPPT